MVFMNLQRNRFLIFSLSFCLIFGFSFGETQKSEIVLTNNIPVKTDAGNRPSVALVLAGGGARGYALIPFLELIEEIGIPVDIVAGTSVGAIIGGLYAAGHSPRELMDAFDGIDWPKVFSDTPVSPYDSILNTRSSTANLIGIEMDDNFTLRMGSGISEGQKAYQVLKDLTLKIPSQISFDTLPIKFRAIGTQLLTGNRTVFSYGELAEVIRARMRVQGLFAPAVIEGVE